MTGEFSWEQLLKVRDGEAFNKLNITMKAGVAIEKLDSNKKTIVDSQGEIHTFDSLILATGSRPLFQKMPSFIFQVDLPFEEKKMQIV